MSMLTLEQRKIAEQRLLDHNHQDYETDIELSPTFSLNNFIVKKEVFRPEITTGLPFARAIHNLQNSIGEKMFWICVVEVEYKE